MQIAKLRNSRGQLWLNVGSAQYVLEDFVNLDNSAYLTLAPFAPLLNPLLKPGHKEIVEGYRRAKAKAHLIRHDCRKPLKFPDASADHILCSHFLEHVYPAEADKILEDFHRVLKTGGTLHLIVPNLETMIRNYLKRQASGAADALLSDTDLSHENPPTFRYRVLEFLGYQGMQHRWMYDKASLTRKLMNGGFQPLPVNDCPSSAVRADDGDDSLHIVAGKN